MLERGFVCRALSAARMSLLAANASRQIRNISTDSRKLDSDDIFVAITGEVFDGHQFIEAAVRAGVAMVVAQQWPAHLDGAWFQSNSLVVPDVVLVRDTRRAYGEIGRAWREQFALPVIAVTGSNGKTTVKEMLSHILAAQHGNERRLATAGNLNNDIGVPQMLLRLAPQHRAAVFELGMNHPGEIAWLASLARANVALVLNAQREHQEFMHSVRATALENGAALKALPPQGVAVYPGDEEFTGLWDELAQHCHQHRFGWAVDAGHAQVLGLTAWARDPAAEAGPGSMFDIHAGGEVIAIELGLLGVHSRRNALAAATAALAAGCGTAAIREGLAAMQAVKGRLVQQAWRDGLLIDDTYNANPDSVRAAIDVLKQLPGQKVLVLGDMGEVGQHGPQFHAEVGAYAAEQGIDLLLALGSATKNSVDAMNRFVNRREVAAGQWFADDLERLIEAILKHSVAGASVLVKGSRFMKMERVVQALAQEVRHAA